MATLQFTYKVTIKLKDEDLLKLTEFLTTVKELGGIAELQKASTAKD